MNIQTVSLRENGYVVNGNTFVPMDISNRGYRDIQDWISSGGVVDESYLPISEENRLREVFYKEKEQRLLDTDYTQLVDENDLLSTTHQDDIRTYRAIVRSAQYGDTFPDRPVWFAARGA